MSKVRPYRPRSGRSSKRSDNAFRWVVVPTVTIGFAFGSLWAVGAAVGISPSQVMKGSGLVAPASARALPPSGELGPRLSVVTLRAGAAPLVDTKDPEAQALAEIQAAAASRISAPTSDRVVAATATSDGRFDEIVRKAALSPEKLAKAFAVAAPPQKAEKRVAKAAPPAPERFGRAAPQPAAPTLLAFADSSPRAEGGALAALSAVAPLEAALPESVDTTPTDDSQAALPPDFEATPDATPVPGRRPQGAISRTSRTPQAADDEADRQPARPEIAKPVQPAAKPGLWLFGRSRGDDGPDRDTKKLAFARPDKPSENSGSGGGLFNNLFRPRAGNGVAVYDISAAKVYMPDGTTLEAHSGIGEMADNPRYVQHKMRGPTPPHTYNLAMREKLFHGVQAIRMLPVDGKNKFGRTGFLTHSYLLRGGRAESHGCVAFKDYNKFLNAFKQGKIRQLVVVPGGGKAAVRMARNGRDA